MHSLIARSGALEINPQAGATHLSENGSSWLYAVTALFGFSFVSVLFYVVACSILTRRSSSTRP